LQPPDQPQLVISLRSSLDARSLSERSETKRVDHPEDADTNTKEWT